MKVRTFLLVYDKLHVVPVVRAAEPARRPRHLPALRPRHLPALQQQAILKHHKIIISSQYTLYCT